MPCNFSLNSSSTNLIVVSEEVGSTARVQSSSNLNLGLAMIAHLKSWFIWGFVCGSVSAQSLAHIRSNAAVANIPMSELRALYDFYNSTHGENWHWRPSSSAIGVPWNFTGHPNPCKDNWQGLGCKLVAPYNHISSITLDAYNLTGTIPASIEDLPYLRIIEIAVSDLTGPIPHTIGNLSLLEILDISSGHLTGQLPDCVGNISSLVQLGLQINALSGTIPASLSRLQSLQVLNMAQNSLHGTIPPELGQLTNLPSFLFYANHLTGTIPPELGNITELYDLYLEVNHLSGSIPASLGNLSRLRNIDLSNNALTGTIPTELYGLSQVHDFYLHTNLLHGSIPDAVQNLSTVQILELSNNKLTGTVPAVLGAMAQLQYIQLDVNHLTGPVPSTMYNLHGLQRLDLDTNYLTGSMPDKLDSWPQMLLFDLSSNYFTGSVSSTIANMTLVQYVALNDNQLTGTVPTTISTLRQLSVLHLQDNLLTGPLTNVFNASTQLALTAIELSSNAFTGHLPEHLFALPHLTSVVAVRNCFYGSIPEAVCRAAQLSSLVLDGLSSAPACRNNLVGVSSSYVLRKSVSGQLPVCLFTLPALTTLHLSGNGLTGSLDVEEVSASLVDVILSHNRLTGSIPVVLQERRWYNFDVSYNRISGTLSSSIESVSLNRSYVEQYSSSLYPNGANSASSEFYTNASVYPALFLQNNRISGAMPGNVLPLVNVSVLGSNLFACDIRGTNLPQHDSGIHNYECGSAHFDITYYAWLALLALLMCAVYALPRYKIAFFVPAVVYLEECRAKWSEYSHQTVNLKVRLTTFGHLLEIIKRTSLLCAAYICAFLLPVYVICSYFHGTYTHEYAYAASGAFLSGQVVVCVVLPLLFVLLCVVLVVFSRRIARIEQQETQESILHLTPAQTAFVYVAYVLVDLIAVAGVNVAYVYIAIYQSSDLLALAQILLSFFKLVWNNIMTILLLRKIVALFVSDQNTNFARYAETQFISLQIFVALVNSVAIPCLVVAVVSPSCFYNVFVSPPQVTSLYTYAYCQVYAESGACTVSGTKVGSTSYSPPFTYSYQCSSSLITFYAPALVNMCIISTFLTPAFQMVLQRAYARSATMPGSFYSRLLTTWTPSILKSPPDEPNKADIYLRANQILIIQIYYLGMLLTFGAMFPPLAVALAVTIAVSVFVSKLKVGHFLLSAARRNLTQYADVLDLECHGVGTVAVLKNATWMLITMSFLFYTLFMFDTLGDEVGFQESYWMLLFVPLLPAAMYVVHFAINLSWVRCGARQERENCIKEKAREEQTEVIELRPLSARSAAVSPPALDLGDDRKGECAETYNVLQEKL